MRTKLRSKVTLLFMTFALLLAIPAIALADNTGADGDGLAPLADNDMAMGSVCSGVESSKSAPVFINRNGTGTNVFANSSTAKVTITSVTGAGLSAEMGTPDTITLPSDWSTKENNTKSASVSSTVKLNSSVAGAGSGSVTYAAKGINASGQELIRSDTMNVSWTTANCDTTAPVISKVVTGTQGLNGWYTSNVGVDWTVSDPESAISSQSGCTDFSVTSDQQATTYTCTATSAGGTSSDSVTIKRDATAPVINDNGTTQTANGAGWFNTAVSNNFSASDVTSGLPASFTSPFAVSSGTAEGSAVKINSGAVTDNAGNTNNGIDSVAYKIDLSAPVISDLGPTSSPNTNGWYNTDVTNRFKASDSVSGLSTTCTTAFPLEAGNNVQSKTTSGEGAAVKVTSDSCTDVAGNTAAAKDSAFFKIDQTAPAVAYKSASPAANANGWNNTDVTATFEATDSLSGMGATDADKTATNTATTGGEGTNVTVESPAFTDRAGNTVLAGTATSPGFKIDKSAPTNVTFVDGPAAGKSYVFGSVPDAPTCTANGDISQLQSPNGCVVSDYSNAVGTHTMTATATDNAGNVETAKRTYTVLAWTFNGFYQPVDMGGVFNTVKGGSTVPLKFELFAGTNELTDTSAITSLTATKVNCVSSAPTDAIEITVTGGTSLRYDSTGGQFIYNWKTPTGAACYKVTLTAQDGSTLIAYFKSLK